MKGYVRRIKTSPQTPRYLFSEKLHSFRLEQILTANPAIVSPNFNEMSVGVFAISISWIEGYDWSGNRCYIMDRGI